MRYISVGVKRTAPAAHESNGWMRNSLHDLIHQRPVKNSVGNRAAQLPNCFRGRRRIKGVVSVKKNHFETSQN